MLSRRVAIKFLPESLTSSPKAVERFITGGTGRRQAKPSNIIAIYDVGGGSSTTTS